MKKTLLSIALGLTFMASQGQNLLTENFDTFPATWTQTNQSSPAGAVMWASGTAGTVANPNPIPPAFNGATLSFAQVNFNSTTGAGNISNWLITPVVNLQSGDVISFYTRTVAPQPNPTPANTFPDRLELRISTNGAASVLPSGGSTGLGDYTTLALSVNPDLTLTGYPGTWTQFSYTVVGLNAETACKIAFRYFVTNGGPAGVNSNIIGLDAVSVDRQTAGTSQFFKNNFAMYPNPASNVINLSSATTTINAVELTDINGRIVKDIKFSNATETQINISDLNSGMYFLKIKSDLGEGTAKIMKN